MLWDFFRFDENFPKPSYRLLYRHRNIEGRVFRLQRHRFPGLRILRKYLYICYDMFRAAISILCLQMDKASILTLSPIYSELPDSFQIHDLRDLCILYLHRGNTPKFLMRNIDYCGLLLSVFLFLYRLLRIFPNVCQIVIGKIQVYSDRGLFVLLGNRYW